MFLVNYICCFIDRHLYRVRFRNRIRHLLDHPDGVGFLDGVRDFLLDWNLNNFFNGDRLRNLDDDWLRHLDVDGVRHGDRHWMWHWDVNLLEDRDVLHVVTLVVEQGASVKVGPKVLAAYDNTVCCLVMA